MKTLTLIGEKRETVGSKYAADLRRKAMVPCVLYGGETPVHFAVTEAELKKFVYTPSVYFADIQIDGKSYKGIMKDIQFHPVTDKPIHVDFLEVFDNKKVRLELPVKVTGNSAGVRAGGKLVVNVKKLKIEALPADIPDEIELDVTNLNIGDKLRISDLNIPGVKFLDAANVVVAAVKMTRSAISAQAAAEAEKK